MTLRELLEKNRGPFCYPSGVMPESTQVGSEKPKDIVISELWVIPMAILNAEIELK
jgi:hypothetical protein